MIKGGPKEMEKSYQPIDTGKLTNVHYGGKEDQREEKAMTSEGLKSMKEIEKEKK